MELGGRSMVKNGCYCFGMVMGGLLMEFGGTKLFSFSVCIDFVLDDK